MEGQRKSTIRATSSTATPPEMLDFHVTASRLANKKPYMMKYIGAKPANVFQIRVKRLPSFQHRSHHIAVAVRVDGVSLSLRHDDTRKNTTWEMRRDSVRFYNAEIEAYRRGKFRFAKLEIG